MPKEGTRVGVGDTVAWQDHPTGALRHGIVTKTNATLSIIDTEQVKGLRIPTGELMVEKAAIPKCDFCSALYPAWVYPAESFVTPSPHPNIDAGSEGAWGACDDCHAFIENDDRIGLADHCLNTQLRAHAGMSAVVRQMGTRAVRRSIVTFHAQFFQARSGPATLQPIVYRDRDKEGTETE